jgi:hypothetical protein
MKKKVSLPSKKMSQTKKGANVAAHPKAVRALAAASPGFDDAYGFL